MKRYIYSMSMSKKDVGAKIEDGTQTIIIHLMKLWLYPNNKSKNHWRKEVASALFNVPTLKGKTKHPSAEFIMKYTWMIHEDMYTNYLKYVLDDYGDSDVDTTMLHDKIAEYFEWLSHELSIRLIVSHKSIYSKLEELGF